MKQIKRSQFVVLTLCVFLSACATGPDFKAPENAMPEKWRTATDQLSSGDVDVEWWKQFNDPALDDLVHRALQFAGGPGDDGHLDPTAGQGHSDGGSDAPPAPGHDSRARHGFHPSTLAWTPRSARIGTLCERAPALSATLYD